MLQGARNANLKKSLKRKDGSEDSTRQDKKDWLASLLVWAQANKSLANAVAPILFALIAETGRQAYMEAGGQPSQFDPSTTQMLGFQQDAADHMAEAVNDETEKQLRATLGQGVDAGESDDELQARIEEVFGAALTYRADRIARSETTRAQNWADTEAWQQLGTVVGKQWFTAQDERVCPWCRPLNGKVIGLDENFYNQGDVIEADGKKLNISYSDISVPPLHANCRCVLLDVVA